MQDLAGGYAPAQQPQPQYAPAPLQLQQQQYGLHGQAPSGYAQAPLYQQGFTQPAYAQPPQAVYLQQQQQQQPLHDPYAQPQQLQQPVMYSQPLQPQMQLLQPGPPQQQQQQHVYSSYLGHPPAAQPAQPPPLQQDQLAALLAALQNTAPAAQAVPAQPGLQTPQLGLSGSLDHIQQPGSLLAQAGDTTTAAGIRAYLQVCASQQVLGCRLMQPLVRPPAPLQAAVHRRRAAHPFPATPVPCAGRQQCCRQCCTGPSARAAREQDRRAVQGDIAPAVGELMAATEAQRPALQERAASKRQKVERRANASQGWFFEAETWLSGTGTSAGAAPIFFEEEVSCCHAASVWVSHGVPCRCCEGATAARFSRRGVLGQLPSGCAVSALLSVPCTPDQSAAAGEEGQCMGPQHRAVAGQEGARPGLQRKLWPVLSSFVGMAGTGRGPTPDTCACVQAKAAAEAPSYSEPADDSQPACAISGERFASFWHEASESWHYDDARRLVGAEAAQCASVPAACCTRACALVD